MFCAAPPPERHSGYFNILCCNIIKFELIKLRVHEWDDGMSVFVLPSPSRHELLLLLLSRAGPDHDGLTRSTTLLASLPYLYYLSILFTDNPLALNQPAPRAVPHST